MSIKPAYERAWIREHAQFRVITRCWGRPYPLSDPLGDLFGDSFGPYTWNNYALVRRAHPMFNTWRLQEDNLGYIDLGFHWHGGVTFTEVYHNGRGNPVVLKTGNDYRHAGDARFTLAEDPPAAVVAEAERLYQHLLVGVEAW